LTETPTGMHSTHMQLQFVHPTVQPALMYRL